jgi:hypothetical protein
MIQESVAGVSEKQFYVTDFQTKFKINLAVGRVFAINANANEDL